MLWLWVQHEPGEVFAILWAWMWCVDSSADALTSSSQGINAFKREFSPCPVFFLFTYHSCRPGKAVGELSVGFWCSQSSFFFPWNKLVSSLLHLFRTELWRSNRNCNECCNNLCDHNLSILKMNEQCLAAALWDGGCSRSVFPLSVRWVRWFCEDFPWEEMQFSMHVAFFIRGMQCI